MRGAPNLSLQSENSRVALEYTDGRFIPYFPWTTFRALYAGHTDIYTRCGPACPLDRQGSGLRHEMMEGLVKDKRLINLLSRVSSIYIFYS